MEHESPAEPDCGHWPVGAAPAAAEQCGWDQSPGWVGRENLKPGTAHWAAGVAMRLSADFSRRKDMPHALKYLRIESRKEFAQERRSA